MALFLFLFACGSGPKAVQEPVATPPTPPAPEPPSEGIQADALVAAKLTQQDATWPQTTAHGPAWADVVTAESNFLTCQGTFALCFYSGAPIDPAVENGGSLACTWSEGDAVAMCECPTYDGVNYVAINSILDASVWQATVDLCGADGSGCVNMTNSDPETGACTDSDPANCQIAPVCASLQEQGTPVSLYPNAVRGGSWVISTFGEQQVAGQYVPKERELDCTSEPYTTYAGCMTALCAPDTDHTNDWVNCACPVYTGPFTVGRDDAPTCDLSAQGGAWSASYTVAD
jgi:hypothetical protein